MTTPPAEPRDEGTPADAAEGAMDQDEYLGRDSDSAGGDDATTEGDEDPRFS